MMMLSQRKLKLIALYSGVSFLRRRKFSFERHPERCRSGKFRGVGARKPNNNPAPPSLSLV